MAFSIDSTIDAALPFEARQQACHMLNSLLGARKALHNWCVPGYISLYWLLVADTCQGTVLPGPL